MFKKYTSILLLAVFLLSTYAAKAQDCNSLYLINATNGRVYNISPLNGNLPTQTATLAMAANSNLAVGANPLNTTQSVFTSSDVASGSPVYVSNTSISTTLPSALGGLTANPNTGSTFGYVYGITATRHLIKASPAPAADLGAISGDTNWTSGTIIGDGFFDNAGNLYTVSKVGANKYLYKINITTKAATLVIQLSGALPENFQGLAYYNNKIYAVEGYISRLLLVLTSTFTARIYEINPNTGVGIVKEDYYLNTQLLPFQGTDDLDLASCQVYTPTAAPTCNELFGVTVGGTKVYKIDLTTLTTTEVASAVPTNHGNVAYGPTPSNLNQNQFITSPNNASGTIYKGTATSAETVMSATINTWGSPIGIGTDPTTGIVYGINNKTLTKWTGSGNASIVGTITSTDINWTNGSTLNDIAVDNGGNLYAIATVDATNVYLFRINPTTLLATKVAKLTGTFPDMRASTTYGNGNGLAYLGNFFYYSRIENSNTRIWKLNASNGASELVGLLSGFTLGDLASCATVTNVPTSFTFLCSGSGAGLQNGPFVKNGSTQTDLLRIPISDAVNGMAQITISGAGLSTSPSPFSLLVQQGATFIDVPVTYNGTSSTGTVTVTVTSGQATGSCSVNISIVDPSSNLEVTKTSDITTATQGDLVTYTITATNNGPIYSPNTKVTDVLPTGLTFVSATPSQGTYDNTTGIWTIGNFGVGVSEAATLTLKATITKTVTNTATIAGDYADPTPANNTSSATVTLIACYKPAVLDASAGNTLDTRVGISALGRAGIENTWPMIRKSGWMVLEAKTKGFVINRVKFNIDNLPVADNGTTLIITSPVEGMMVYDTTNNCLKVFTTTNGVNFAWFCMNTQTCPE